MSTLTVRFIGICCFLDAPPKDSRFKKRVVLPVDTRVDERADGEHVPYLEVDILDEPMHSGGFADTVDYTRENLRYRRFHLSGDRITIRNSVPPPHGLRVLSTYEEQAPSLTRVTPDLREPPGPEYFEATPPADKVVAFFDIQYGDLHAGPPAPRLTTFSQPTQWPGNRRLASWIELQVPIEDGRGPVIDVESFGTRGFGRRTIELSDRTSRITIGNQLEHDIDRKCIECADPTQLRPEDFRAHFALYYDLFPNVPANRSVPVRSFAIENGCVPVRFP